MASQCEQLLVVRDAGQVAVAVVVVHSTRLGPAHGGIRRWAYAGLDDARHDAVALAQAMTWKCALAEVPAGGGKAVILDHPGLDRAGVYRLVGQTVEQLGGTFFTGPDVNTTAADLRVVAEETQFVATDATDGAGDLAAATAEGVLSALLALVEQWHVPLASMHVVVQGLGAVGMGLCARLAALGARLSVCDLVTERVASAVAQYDATAIALSAATRTPCDVFAPCALGGILTEEVARTLPVRGVCGAANNVFEDAVAAEVMHGRGVIVVPDFIANAGALIQGASWNLRHERVDSVRLRRIAITTREVLARARVEDRPPSVLALELARERLERGVRPF